MKHIHKQRRYDWECEIFKNKDDIIQVNFVDQRTNEIHLHLNKTYLTIEKNFKQPQKVKTWNKHEQICFRAHERPAADPDSGFTGVSSTDELETGWAPRGKDNQQAKGQSHRAEPTPATTPRFHCRAGFMRRRHTKKGDSGRHYSKATSSCNSFAW